MPCNADYGDTHTKTVYVESGKQTQRLCGVFSVLEKQGILYKVLSEVDWAEAGVSKASTVTWWEHHKIEDQLRRQREQQAAELKRLKQKALNRLSPAERKALGY